jgi:Holliday junction resolvase RusA-like endonuclease
MAYAVHFLIEMLPKTVNAWRGKHWRIRYAEDQKWVKRIAGELTVVGKPQAPLKTARLKLVRHSSSCPDHDGLVSSFKTVIDALVRNGVLEDDSYAHIGMPVYGWAKARPKHGHIEVTVEEI